MSAQVPRKRGFAQLAKEFLLGTPVQLADPAKIHISQVADEVYNPGSPNSSANCGPTSVIMAIRLLGLKVPGEERYRGEDLVLFIRRMGTGQTDRWTGTHNGHLQRVLAQAGAKWSVHRDPRIVLKKVREGYPVIMAGNPAVRGCYTQRFEYYDIRRYDNGHWIVVSNYDAAKRTYTVNDPQSTIGPVTATEAELMAFQSKDGNFGLAVWRA